MLLVLLILLRLGFICCTWGKYRTTK